MAGESSRSDREPPRARAGRRTGKSGTREAIRAAAAEQFAARGFDRTSVRSIAAQAGVDPALVLHFFGSKLRLFVEVVYPPFPPEQLAAAIAGGPSDTAGRRLAQLVVFALEQPVVRSKLVALVRAAAAEPEAAGLVRELLSQGPFAQITAALDVDDAQLRANLIGSQMVGLVMARYIVGVEPLASLPPAGVVDAIAPNLQRYLTGSLLPCELPSP